MVLLSVSIVTCLRLLRPYCWPLLLLFRVSLRLSVSLVVRHNIVIFVLSVVLFLSCFSLVSGQSSLPSPLSVLFLAMTLSVSAIVVGTLSLVGFVSLGMSPLMSLILSSLAIPPVRLILLLSRLSFSVWLGLPLLLLWLPHPCLHLFHRRDHHLHPYLHPRHHHHLYHHLHHHHLL